MQTIQSPEETVARMYELFTGRWKIVDGITNAYLKKIVEENKFMPDDSKFQENIKNYLQTHETDIQRDYIESEDAKIKSDIYDLYKEYHVGEKES
jgi:hypothetical protein